MGASNARQGPYTKHHLRAAPQLLQSCGCCGPGPCLTVRCHQGGSTICLFEVNRLCLRSFAAHFRGSPENVWGSLTAAREAAI